MVLGNGRSGTSMTTGILKILGVNMDAREYPNQFNPKGDFESIDAHKINTRIYQLATGKVYSEHHWYPPTYEQVLKLKDNQEIQEMIKKFVDKHKSELWGWKNPKTSLTIELYLPYLENPHFVCIFRNPIKNAQSIVRMAGIDFYRALWLANFYNEAIRKFLIKYDYPRLLLSFEDIIKNPIEEGRKIADFLGVEPEDKEISNFVMPR